MSSRGWVDPVPDPILPEKSVWTLAARIYMGHCDVGKQLNSRVRSKYSGFHAWYLLSILLMLGVRCIYFIFQVLSQVKIAIPHTLEELKASIRHEIDCTQEPRLSGSGRTGGDPD